MFMCDKVIKEFLISRGQCCGKVCQCCPFEPKQVFGSTEVVQDIYNYGHKENNKRRD